MEKKRLQRWPERTCIVCRRKDKQDELYRLVWNGSELVLDRGQRGTGRGGYVHKTWSCVSKMSEAKKWEKVFRLSVGEMKSQSMQRAFLEAKEEVLKGDESQTEKVIGSKRNRIRI